MTDHYQAALDACRIAESATWKSDPDRAIQEAQVHATLELANQQRIANLIALYVGDTKSHPAGGEFADACHSRLADQDSIKALRIETP